MIKKTLTILCLILLAFSCTSDDDSIDLRASENLIIEQYLDNNNLTAKKTESGLYYIITADGNDEHPTEESYATFEDKIYGLDGIVYRKPLEGGISEKLFYFVPPLREGMQLIGKGGAITVIAPSDLGLDKYGRESYDIPDNTVTIFDIELLDFK